MTMDIIEMCPNFALYEIILSFSNKFNKIVHNHYVTCDFFDLLVKTT